MAMGRRHCFRGGEYRLREDQMVVSTDNRECEGDRSGLLQEIPQLNYSIEYVTTHLQEIPQRIR